MFGIDESIFVHAKTDIKEGSKTDFIELSSLQQNISEDGSEDSFASSIKIEVEYIGGKIVWNKDVSPLKFLKSIISAKDYETSNVELSVDSRGLCLTAVTDMDAGDILTLWFDEVLLVTIVLPYIKLYNFENTITRLCPICNLVCDSRSLVKLHIMTFCIRSAKDLFWGYLKELGEEIFAPEGKEELKLRFETLSKYFSPMLDELYLESVPDDYWDRIKKLNKTKQSRNI